MEALVEGWRTCRSKMPKSWPAPQYACFQWTGTAESLGNLMHGATFSGRWSWVPGSAELNYTARDHSSHFVAEHSWIIVFPDPVDTTRPCSWQSFNHDAFFQHYELVGQQQLKETIVSGDLWTEGALVAQGHQDCMDHEKRSNFKKAFFATLTAYLRLPDGPVTVAKALATELESRREQEEEDQQ